MHTCFQFPCLGKTLIPTGKPESFSVYIYASYYLEIFMPHLLKYKSRHRNFLSARSGLTKAFIICCKVKLLSSHHQVRAFQKTKQNQKHAFYTSEIPNEIALRNVKLFFLILQINGQCIPFQNKSEMDFVTNSNNSNCPLEGSRELLSLATMA